MPVEPAVKRALTFIDGQNLFHSARLAFGYTYPNYDVRALADRLCRTDSSDNSLPLCAMLEALLHARSSRESWPEPS